MSHDSGKRVFQQEALQSSVRWEDQEYFALFRLPTSEFAGLRQCCVV